MDNAVIISALDKSFNTQKQTTRVLNNISLTVAPGEIVALLGPSGCGKSTLLRIMAGLEQPDRGSVQLHDARGSRQKVGMVFQSYTSFPWLTVEDNVAFGLRLCGLSREQGRTRARAWLDKVGLAHKARAWPGDLSGGMQQRVAIARALAVEPAILLMDEPFGALDAFTRYEMQMLLLNLWRETHKTIIFVTHDIDEALLLADRVVLFSPHPGEIDRVVAVTLPRPRNDLIHPADLTRYGSLRAGLRERFFSMKAAAQ
ncbi:ABC transporter ATP-binding protein [Sodalis sp. RH21]|uniref:ABC transporter ATP-binding protein n=1 Tax=unclassified Sodalis (in: enterobacteria) TaxID=2636512 RepID=UPI0039B695F9